VSSLSSTITLTPARSAMHARLSSKTQGCMNAAHEMQDQRVWRRSLRPGKKCECGQQLPVATKVCPGCNAKLHKDTANEPVRYHVWTGGAELPAALNNRQNQSMTTRAFMALTRHSAVVSLSVSSTHTSSFCGQHAVTGQVTVLLLSAIIYALLLYKAIHRA
jgi:hypothetical protein